MARHAAVVGRWHPSRSDKEAELPTHGLLHQRRQRARDDRGFRIAKGSSELCPCRNIERQPVHLHRNVEIAHVV